MLTAVPCGLDLDTVLSDGFAALLDSQIVLSFTDISAGLVAHRIERYQLRVIVFVAFLLLQVTVDEGLRTVEKGVVSGVKGMPPSCVACVFLCSSANHRHGDGRSCQQYVDGLTHLFFIFPLLVLFFL